MKKYIPIIFSVIGGILLMYGVTHERAFYIYEHEKGEAHERPKD